MLKNECEIKETENGGQCYLKIHSMEMARYCLFKGTKMRIEKIEIERNTSKVRRIKKKGQGEVIASSKRLMKPGEIIL